LQVAIWVREQMKLYPPTIGGRALVVNFGRQPTTNNGLDDYPYPLPGAPLHVPAPVLSSSPPTLTAPLPPHIHGTNHLPLPVQYPYPQSHAMISHPSLQGYGIPTETYLPSVFNEQSMNSMQTDPYSGLRAQHTQGLAPGLAPGLTPGLTPGLQNDYGYEPPPFTLHGVFREPDIPSPMPSASPSASSSSSAPVTIPLPLVPASPVRGLESYFPEYGTSSSIGQSLGLGLGGIGGDKDAKLSEVRPASLEGTPVSSSTGSSRVVPGSRPGVAITRSGSGTAASLPLSSPTANLLGGGLSSESILLESLNSLALRDSSSSSQSPLNSSISSSSSALSTSSSLYQDPPIGVSPQSSSF